MLRPLLLLLALIMPALPAVAGAWAIDRADPAPPQPALRVVAGERVDPVAATRQLRWYRLVPQTGDAASPVQFLVFQRDRGQRAWLLDDAGRVLERVPRGAAAGARSAPAG